MTGLDARTRAAIEHALGVGIAGGRPVAGGDINEAFAVRTRDGREFFVKRNASADPRMFPTEARGLAWLAAARALRTPRVVAVSEPDGDVPFLVLELLADRQRAATFDEVLGRGLAELHRAGAPCFGLDHDNFVGRLPQDNRPAADWPTFYFERRLEPLVAAARARGLLEVRDERVLEALRARLEDLCGPAEPPARLHGDLWGGNVVGDENGGPALVDPAVYGGHREVDLAMMRLFGGFDATCFAAYAEVFPLAPGHEDRIALYQLYPLLVHVSLFGGSYVGAVRRALARYAS